MSKYQIWNVEITESILGTLEDGEAIRLFRLDPCEPVTAVGGVRRQFESGREGIFFLRRAEVGGSGVGPSDLYTPRLGDSGVLFDDANDVLAKLRAVSGGQGNSALGSGLPQGSDHYRGADFAVAGALGRRVSSGDLFGWEYVEFELGDAETIWNWQGFPEAGVPPLVLPDDFVIRVGKDEATDLEQAGPQIFLLERADPLGSDRVVFMPSGGPTVGIFPIASFEEVITLLDNAHDLDKTEEARLARAHAALDHARALVTLAGELPFP